MGCGTEKRKGWRGGGEMSKVRMMTVEVLKRVPMFDRPKSEITAAILVAAMREEDRKELEGHIKGWTKYPFSREDL